MIMAMDDRITAYIDRAQPFAQPILRKIRLLVHKQVPDVQETLKWGMPFFTLAGRDVVMMASFKAHAGMGIFDGAPMGGGETMGNVGTLTCVDDLRDGETLAARLQASADLARAGKPMRTPKKAAPKPELAMPDDLAAALAADPVALEKFGAFPPGARREYVDWVISAKQSATRARRIETTVAQAAEGKKMGWKYEAC
jgi:uncharacterized protein YdeI (YjbR/CyaY-like superfamily)